MDTTSLPAVAQYNAQERVLCYHGNHVYEAKVLKTKNFDERSLTTGEFGPHYLVHYKGWKQKWDEWVPENRLLKLNEENLELQKKLQLTHGATSHGGSASKAPNKSTAGGSASTRGGRKDGTRGTKRAREDEEKKAEMKLTVPEVLKSILVDDWEAVTKNHQLVTLPREPTAFQVLEDFAEYVRETNPLHLKDPLIIIQSVIEGYQAYFDRALGATLLYRFERPQYAEVRKNYWTGQKVVVGKTEKEMSYVYGAEHLLRLLVQLPQIISTIPMDAESVTILRDYTNALMAYMVKEKDRLFQREYENTSLQYQNIARS